MRKIMIVGNWKMHLNVQQSSLLVKRLSERIKTHRNIEIVLAPSMLSLQPLSLEIDRRKFRLAAQNAYFVDEGAFTGEISFAMMHELVDYVIIGHSERRRYFHEDLETICSKMAAAIRNNISPILCIGETKHERENHETKRVLHDQLTTAISNLTSAEIEQLVVAYEPVWAISSGNNFTQHEAASPDEVQEIVAYIRGVITELYGAKAAESVQILYGGSSNAENTYGYLSVPGIDGLLPGGASLNYEEFSGMVATAERLQHERQKS